MKVVPLQILFVLRVLCLVTLAAGQPKAPLKCSKVCAHFTSIIPEKRIKSYRRTEPRCAKQAIIFITQRSLEICADPDAEWVKKIVWKLDEKKASAASPLPRSATSAVPEKPGIFHKHIGLTVTAPSQATAATTLFQGTGTPILESTLVPAARTEATSKSTPAMQNTTQFSAGLSPLIREIATHSEVSSEANRNSLKSSTHSTPYAAGMVPSQPIPYSTALVHGFDTTVGSIEEPEEYAANSTADVQDMTSSSSNSDPMSTTKGLDHPVLFTSESLDPTSATANTSDTASRSFNSDLPSILNSTEIGSVPAIPLLPENTSVPTLNPTTAIDKGPSVHTNKIFSSSGDAFGTRTFDYSSPLGKQDLPDMLVFTSQTFSGQARAQMTTKRPNNPPSHSFLSRSQTHFIIPASLVGGLIACSVAAVWLYTKFGVRTEAMSGEMVQGLLYQKEGHQNNVYPMEII